MNSCSVYGRHRLKTIASSILILGAFWVVAGCASPPRTVADPTRQDWLRMLLPSRIEIVEPFTTVKSFDDDATPDGIELRLRAVNFLDHDGLMIVGEVRVELYEYIAASADHKGRQLDRWQMQLGTEQDQRTFWNSSIQMYEFHLEIDPARVPVADKYVMLVTYTSPLAEYLTDEFTINSPVTSR